MLGVWSYAESSPFVGALRAGFDRVDVELGYSPKNCRWATWSEQQANKRSSNRSADTFVHYLDHNTSEARTKGLAGGA